VELKPGIKIHGYTLDGFINSGATAEVWRILDDLGHEKALKIFSPVQKVDEATLDVLIDEFKLLYKLDHPHILKSEIMGAYQKVPYIIMPYYNDNLAEEMTRRSHQGQGSNSMFNSWFSEEECLMLMEQMGSGLAYLHKEGIIHQDVKPENILFDKASDPINYILTDFGISAKIKENIARRTLPRQQVYALTPAYAAPEQFNGRLEYKSDVFSLGVLLFEMCEGRLPFTRHGLSPDSFGNIRLPEFRNIHLSTPFKQLILSALSENPQGRPSAKELEDFAVQVRGNRITMPDPVSVRSDKITVIQPKPIRSLGKEYVPLDLLEKNYGSYTPDSTQRIEKGEYEDESSRRRIPQTKISTGNSKSRNVRWATWIIVISVMFCALVTGFIFNRNRVEKNMVIKADQYFDSGNIKESNIIYNELAETRGIKYYEKKLSTDKILNANYEEIRPFKNNRAAVRQGIKWGYIDKKGNQVIDCQYVQAEEFSNKTAVACKSDTECGIIDTSGAEKAPFIYTGLQSGGNDRWRMIRMENEQRITIDYNF
jgi:serine/threonine protein kinase